MTEGKEEPGTVLNALQDVADDNEAVLIESLAIKAGYWWKCTHAEDPDDEGCGNVNSKVDTVCGGCGKAK